MFDSNVCYRRLIATPKTLYIRLFDTGQQQSIADAKSADIERSGLIRAVYYTLIVFLF